MKPLVLVRPPVGLPPKPFLFDLDPSSSLVHYDELGLPKKWIPSARLPSGEWAYSLSPLRDSSPLRAEALDAHLAEIALLKASLK